MQVLKTIRTHPKKTIFGAVVLGFSSRWINNIHENHLHRHATCQSVKLKGLEPIHFLGKPKKITVFYNPAAHDGKSGKLFIQNAKPILHLSGCNVHVVKLDYEGQAKELMLQLQETETDMIVCAGGDGTVNEIVTGILRRPDADRWANVPIGVIPLGRSNTICRLLTNNGDKSGDKKEQTHQQWITSACANLFANNTAMVDVFRVQSEDGKNAYGLTDFRWGSYRDAQAKQHKYWYWGGLRYYVTYFFRSLHSDARVSNELELQYSGPIKVSEDDYNQQQLGPLKASQQSSISLSKIVASILPSFFKTESPQQQQQAVNEEQQQPTEEVGNEFESGETQVETVEFMVSANTHKLSQRRKELSMKMVVEEQELDFGTFVGSGPGSVVDGRHQPVSPVLVKDVGKFRIVPKNKPESFYSIDNENFEAFPCTVELLPNKLKMVLINT